MENFINMKQSHMKDKQAIKSNFLQRFAGKLNIITKNGQIQQQNTFKLPSLPYHQSKRNSTINLKVSSLFLSRSNSQYNRDFTIKSAISIHRAQKYSKQNERNLIDITNSFTKNTNKKLLKTTKVKHKTFEPLTSLPFSRKNVELQNRCNQIQNLYSVKSVNGRNNDYFDFLNELDMIRKAGKDKIK